MHVYSDYCDDECDHWCWTKNSEENSPSNEHSWDGTCFKGKIFFFLFPKLWFNFSFAFSSAADVCAAETPPRSLFHLHRLDITKQRRKRRLTALWTPACEGFPADQERPKFYLLVEVKSCDAKLRLKCAHCLSAAPEGILFLWVLDWNQSGVRRERTDGVFTSLIFKSSVGLC